MVKEERAYDLLIIGAGLTGLTINYLLRNSNLSIGLVEARSRIGGRIETVTTGSGEKVEMGATWLGNQHGYLSNLLSDLKIDTFVQIIGDKAIYEAISTSPFYLAQIPTNPNPTLRIAGGSETLINKLSEYVLSENLHLDTQVDTIKSSESQLNVDCQHVIISAKRVVSTLPPNLLVNTIGCLPKLDSEFIKIAKATHTWMGESIKIALTYNEPFWRQESLSGTIMSNVGPIPEMYDHSNIQDNKYALMGFFNGSYFQLSREQRLTMIMNQLKKYYGNLAESYTHYEERVWKNDKYTFANYSSHVLPHQLNGHDVYQSPIMNNMLFIAGTETSAHYPGYMEGAIYSAMHTIKNLEKY